MVAHADHLQWQSWCPKEAEGWSLPPEYYPKEPNNTPPAGQGLLNHWTGVKVEMVEGQAFFNLWQV